MNKSHHSLLLLLLLACASGALASDTWNQWRGPQRDGHAPWFGEVAAWPSAARTVWSVGVGVGHASPVTDHERVCVHAREGDDEVVSCHSLADGSVLWRQSHAVSFKPAMGGGHHGPGPKSTPALADGRLYTLGITTVLSAFDLESGELLWRRDFGQETEGAWPRWGTSLSPAPIDGDVVLQLGRRRGAILRIDGASGETVWEIGGDGAAYSSPVVATFDQQRQIVVATSEELLGITPRGEVLWRTQHPSTMLAQGIATPVALADRLVVSTGNRPLRALRPRRVETGWRVDELWRRPDITMKTSSAVGLGDRVCGLAKKRKGHAFCVAAETGVDLWQGPPRFGEHASIVVVPGALLYQLEDGELVALAADGDRYRELGRVRSADSEVWSHPAPLGGGRLLIKSYDLLALLELQ